MLKQSMSILKQNKRYNTKSKVKNLNSKLSVKLGKFEYTERLNIRIFTKLKMLFNVNLKKH